MGKTKKRETSDKKREADEAVDFLKQVDKPESMGGGRDFVQEHVKAEKRKFKEEQSQVANALQRNARITYRTKLAAYAQTKLNDLLEWAKDWEVKALPTHGHTIYIYKKAYETKEGVQLIAKSPKGNVYMKGITMSYEPEIDMHAINVLVEQTENSMDSERGLLYEKPKKTEGGIILPDGYEGESN
jgi:hypothetical protein